MTKKMNSISLENILNSSKANIIYSKEKQIDNLEKFIEKKYSHYESNLLVTPVISLVAKLGQSFLNLIAEILKINLLELSTRDNYYEIERELINKKTKLIIIKDIDNLFCSLDSLDKLAIISQIIFLNKRLKISFVLLGKIDSSLLELIKEEFSIDLQTL